MAVDSSTSGMDIREFDMSEDWREERRIERSREGIGVGTFSLVWLVRTTEGGMMTGVTVPDLRVIC